MKLQFKIIVISFVVAIITAMLFALNNGIHRGTEYFGFFGLVAFFGGLLEIIIGLFLLLFPDKRYAQGFLMGGGILMLVGFVTCSGSLSFH